MVGALQYELNVAEIAATGMGLSGLKVSEMSIGAFTTIALVMTAGILSGITCCIFGLKNIWARCRKKKRKMTAADLALALMPPSPCLSVCAAHISVPMWEPGPLSKTVRLSGGGISALAMAVFEYLIVKKKMEWLENFSIAVSMIIGMAAAVLINL